MRTREVPTNPSVVRPKNLLKASKPLLSRLFFLPSCLGFSSSDARAGDNVSALKAEIRTEIAIVTANCWYIRPVMPGIARSE